MMNSIAAILLVISFSVSVIQCNSSDTKKEVKKTGKSESNYNTYYPVTDGNYWTYINEAPRDETELFKVEASDTKKIESGIQVKMSCFPYLTKETTPQTIRIKSNGEIEITDYMGSNGVIIPAPDNFKKGYQWNFGIFSGTIRDIQSVKTETGAFEDCYYVMLTEGFTFSFEMWFKKDVGIVKWGANRTNPPTPKFTYYVLKEYKLN